MNRIRSARAMPLLSLMKIRPRGKAGVLVFASLLLALPPARAQDARPSIYDLLLQGMTAFNAGDHPAAEPPLREALERLPAPADPRGDEPALAQSRGLAGMHLGAIALGRRDLVEAEVLLTSALPDLESAGRADWEAFALTNLAEVLLVSGRPARAQLPIEAGLERAIECGDGTLEILLWEQASRMWTTLGESTRARAELDAAIGRADRVGSASRRAQAYRTQAEWFLDRGEWNAGEEAARRSLELAEDPHDIAQAHGVLGNVAKARGDYAEAMMCFDLARAVGVELEDRRLIALADTSLAIVDQFLGHHDRARERLEWAIEVFEASGDAVNRRTAETQLAGGWLVLGDPARARQLAEAVAAEAAASGDRTREAVALQVRWAALRAGSDTESLAAACEARLDQARTWGLDVAEAVALQDRAILGLREGRIEAARADAELAADRFAQAGAANRTAEAMVLVAQAALAQRDAAGAAAALGAAETSLGRAEIERLSVEQASKIRARDDVGALGELFQDLVALRLEGVAPEAPVRDEVLREGFAAAGRFKGRALLEGMAERWTETDEHVEDLRVRRRLAVADAAAILLAVRAAESEERSLTDIDELRARAVVKRNEAAELAARLAGLSPRAAGLDVPLAVAPARVLADAVGAGGVLIDYAEGTERLFAYVLRDAGLSFHDLGPKDARAADVSAYLALISDPARLAPPGEVAAAGSRLFESLLAPLLEDLPPAGAGPRRVAVVPSPVVASLPFEALVTAAPERPERFAQVSFVIDAHEISYAPSSPVLAMLAQLGPRQHPGRVLLLGDPIYTAAAGARLRSDEAAATLGPWPDLPGTRDEAFEVAGLVAALSGGSEKLDLSSWRARDGGIVDEAEFRLLFGGAATPSALREDLSGFAILHVAGHGWVDLERPERSGLALSPRAGDDGSLLLHDILDLDLDLRIAVLSACQTGRGRVRRGEGVQSLVRAFLFAGARSVVASMWQVDDVETAYTMRGFYEGLLRDELTPSDALRRARLAVRHAQDAPDRFLATGRRRGDLLPGSAKALEAEAKRKQVGHPFFWAPFVYVGRAVD